MRTFIEQFESRFAVTHQRSVFFLSEIPDEKLFWRPSELKESIQMFSCGEYLLRSAGAVEQAMGGLTRRLWDDPFEWTLPEAMTGEGIRRYLNEVEDLRIEGFRFLKTDEELLKEIPAPVKLKKIIAVLLESITRAEHYQGRAFAIFQLFSDKKLPRF